MRANDVTPSGSATWPATAGRGKVLSLFVNLDPSEFGTIPARASQVRSVLDRAHRVVRAAEEGLGHAERLALRADLARVEAELDGTPATGGARGLAVFASSQAGLFAALRLPVAVDHEPVVADTPCLEPLTSLADGEPWAVLLVNRSFARLLVGGRDTLEELALVESDVHGRHDQGGWSQARYQRSVEHDVHEHLKAVAETAARLLRPQRPAGLVLGAPEETRHAAEAALPSDLRGLVAGHVTVDVEHASADEVRAAAAEVIDRLGHEREDRLLARLREGLARRDDGRASAGWPTRCWRSPSSASRRSCSTTAPGRPASCARGAGCSPSPAPAPAPRTERPPRAARTCSPTPSTARSRRTPPSCCCTSDRTSAPTSTSPPSCASNPGGPA